jgi:hypothetical protein
MHKSKQALVWNWAKHKLVFCKKLSFQSLRLTYLRCVKGGLTIGNVSNYTLSNFSLQIK